jgi:hypothetical protein
VLARDLLVIGRMRQTAGLLTDMMTLARLHAALDSVVEARELIATIHETSTTPRPGLEHVGALFDEARELLRALLTPPELRQAVGSSRS